MNLRQAFGANVRNHRKARGLTQEELAERVELSMETIGKIERGVAAPSFDTAEKLALALDVPPLALFGVGKSAAPSGERGRLLARIGATLSGLNDAQLARASKILDAFAGD